MTGPQAKQSDTLLVAKYRKWPVVVEAIQRHLGQNDRAVIGFIGAGGTSPAHPGSLAIDTLEGTMWADDGDWIIRGVAGEFYPCKPDIFNATYEAVDDDRYRIEADCAMRDYDDLALDAGIMREALEKIARTVGIVTRASDGSALRTAPEYTGEGARHIAADALARLRVET